MEAKDRGMRTNLYELKVAADKAELLSETLDAIDAVTAALEVITPTMSNLESIVNDILPNMPEILLADTNAATATTKASEASASAIASASSAASASASATASASSAASASASASNAQASATSATESQNSASDSAASAAEAYTYAQGAFLADGNAFDLGYVSDAVNLFPTDLGGLV